MKKISFAFMGFRHGHIFDALNRIKTREDVEMVGACEEDLATRKSLLADNKVKITHESYLKMLDEVPCDVVAVGDYYGKRGSILIEALRRGKHVLTDKPICTSQKELDEIIQLAQSKNLVVGCQLDLRDLGPIQEMRRLLREGKVGEVQAISFNGEHPLLWGTRTGWYFEEGKHGGSINDIAIHAIDAIEWMTGLRFQTIQAARCWHVRPQEAPHFKDCAQMMLTMNNGCGVLGDVSYLAPDSMGYVIPQYWQMRFWGTEGLLENDNATKNVTLYSNQNKEAQVFKGGSGTPGAYLESFLQEVRGQKTGLHLSSAETLRACRTTLKIQSCADQNLTNASVASSL